MILSVSGFIFKMRYNFGVYFLMFQFRNELKFIIHESTRCAGTFLARERQGSQGSSLRHMEQLLLVNKGIRAKSSDVTLEMT